VAEFELTRDQLSRLDEVNLKLNITNSTGGSVTLAPAKALIQQVEIYGNQGGDMLCLMRYEDLWTENIHYNSNDWALVAASQNSNANYSTAGNAIADTATATYFIPIKTLINAGGLHLAGLKSMITIRFTFQSSTYTVISGSIPTVTAATLLLEGVYEPKEIADMKSQMYMKSPLTVKFLDRQRNTTTLALAASSTYEVNLSSINGLCAYLWFGIRAAARTAANQLTFTATQSVSSFDIQDQNGQSIIGFYARQISPVDENSCIVYAESGLDNTFPLFTGLVMVPFTENINHSFMYGAGHGFQLFSSYEKLRFTTSSIFTPGNFEIVVLAAMYNQVYIRNGFMIRAN
jgi:hypothetical protein